MKGKYVVLGLAAAALIGCGSAQKKATPAPAASAHPTLPAPQYAMPTLGSGFSAQDKRLFRTAAAGMLSLPSQVVDFETGQTDRCFYSTQALFNDMGRSNSLASLAATAAGADRTINGDELGTLANVLIAKSAEKGSAIWRPAFEECPAAIPAIGLVKY